MSRRLEVAVEIDTTGWLRDGLELRYVLGPNRTIRPTMVRVACNANIDELLAQGSVVMRCARYNNTLGELHSLRNRLSALVLRGQPSLEPGSDVWRAFQELSRLGDVISRRQSDRMGNNVVNLKTLDLEVAFFESYHTKLAAIITTAEKTEKAKGVNPARQAMDAGD